MDAALDSHFDLDSRDTYSPASKCSSALPHQPSRSPRHDQYEISGLKPGQSPPRSPDRRWCHHQDSHRLATNQYEICGLDYAKKGFFMRSSSTVVRGPWPGARRVSGESMRILLQILLRPAA